jgi:gamma-butyrobetaine dioxygenase
MSSSFLLTPDFAIYPEVAGLRVVAVDASFVTVAWADGHEHRFHHLYLAENAGDGVIDPATRERILDPTSLPLDLAPTGVSVHGADLVIEWPDRPTATVQGAWLRAMADGAGSVHHGLPPKVTWDNAALGGELPTLDGPAVLTDDGALLEFVRTLASHGVARLRHLPTANETVARVATRVGVIRETSFGRLFDVVSKPNPDSVAYTTQALLPHTDLPTREVPPGYQLLHCRENTCADGWSVMVDGFRVAEVVRDEDPAAWELLTTVAWTFTNRSRDVDYRWSAPLLHLDDTGAVDEVRLFHPLRTVPHIADDRIADAYASVCAYSTVSKRPEMAIRSAFAPGDLVMFDNRRVLHGRDSFDPQGGQRHLQGCYVDRDDVYSRLRILQRPTGGSRA